MTAVLVYELVANDKAMGTPIAIHVSPGFLSTLTLMLI